MSGVLAVCLSQSLADSEAVLHENKQNYCAQRPLEEERRGRRWYILGNTILYCPASVPQRRPCLSSSNGLDVCIVLFIFMEDSTALESASPVRPLTCCLTKWGKHSMYVSIWKIIWKYSTALPTILLNKYARSRVGI